MDKIVELYTDGTLAQQCYDQFLSDIVDGVLKPGEKLKITPLKNRLNVGQTPVREALSRLVACGLVEVKDNKGFYVVQVSESDIRDIYQTFTQIENLAIELAIRYGDDTWKANIVAQLYRLSLIENQHDPVILDIWVQRNYDFHRALIAGCNSPTLLEVRENLYLKFDRYCKMSYQFIQSNISHNHMKHQELADAILQKDVVKAQVLMTSHINGPLEDIIQHLKQYNVL